jgi:hypothetical protein
MYIENKIGNSWYIQTGEKSLWIYIEIISRKLSPKFLSVYWD